MMVPGISVTDLRPALLLGSLLLSGCGERATEDILRGGIPARTDLHQASTLPPDSVRTVARRDFGWRLVGRRAWRRVGTMRTRRTLLLSTGQAGCV